MMRKYQKIRFAFRVSALLLLVLSMLLTSCENTRNEELPIEIRCLDVGEGGAALIRTPEGDVLVDAGTNDGEALLVLHLQMLGVRSLRLAVFTHADEDHVGGADGILRQFPTERVWITSFFEETENVKRLTDAARDTGALLETVVAGEQLLLGKTALTVLSPDGGMPWKDSNDAGLVLKLACGDMSALFMGDATTKTESFLLDTYEQTQLACDILIVGHHGAASSSGADFLLAATPRYAAISCGARNLYGHPHGATLARLEAVNAEILRTDVLGDIVFRTDGERIVHNGSD